MPHAERRLTSLATDHSLRVKGRTEPLQGDRFLENIDDLETMGLPQFARPRRVEGQPAGDQNDRTANRDGADPTNGLDPVEFRHDNIEHDQVGARRPGDRGHQLPAIGELEDLPAERFGDPANKGPEPFIVIDDRKFMQTFILFQH